MLLLRNYYSCLLLPVLLLFLFLFYYVEQEDGRWGRNEKQEVALFVCGVSCRAVPSQNRISDWALIFWCCKEARRRRRRRRCRHPIKWMRKDGGKQLPLHISPLPPTVTETVTVSQAGREQLLLWGAEINPERASVHLSSRPDPTQHGNGRSPGQFVMLLIDLSTSVIKEQIVQDERTHARTHAALTHYCLWPLLAPPLLRLFLILHRQTQQTQTLFTAVNNYKKGIERRKERRRGQLLPDMGRPHQCRHCEPRVSTWNGMKKVHSRALLNTLLLLSFFFLVSNAIIKSEEEEQPLCLIFSDPLPMGHQDGAWKKCTRQQ